MVEKRQSRKVRSTPTAVFRFNGTAPAPVTNAAFATALSRALNRPAILPVPSTPLRLGLGAFAEELLLGGQRVMPRAALESGFRFLYPVIDDALVAIVGRPPEPTDAGRPRVATGVPDRGPATA
jgi:NAD dependent epimerase/dehydratase family enzyme